MNYIATNCPECDGGILKIQRVILTGERCGEQFSVTVPGLGCDQCDYKTIANSQSGEFTKAISDAYRGKHGLLTGEEIKELRGRLGMNQIHFAEYLGVGVSSVKRWECGQIQDKAMDELIRLKTDSEWAQSNYRSLEIRLNDACRHPIAAINGGIDLSTYSDQKYYPSAQKNMGVDMSELEAEYASSQDREPVAA